ncbi:unnamed protein product [Echinostoma caproni]|uniref:Uncharacterized protein n=1 Tax=Echinostoma caproni TaxID=27848 RepID=A0A183B8I5_9TREM|nr:unnamed protein product [Echinostoma caproni]
MYFHIVTPLPTDIAKQVFEFIITMPEPVPYTQLKKAVFTRTAVSDECRLDELFGDLKIGDCTPSHLLRHMRQLLGTRVLDDAILRQLWLKRLPPRIREVLSILSNSSLDEMALAADKMFEANPAPHHTTACSNPTPTGPHCDDFTSRMGNLELQRQQLVLHLSLSRSSSRSRSRSRLTSQTRRNHPPASSNPQHCWYHQRFGPRAKKCTPTCSFTSQGNPKAGQ